jgi:hypothetical protein
MPPIYTVYGRVIPVLKYFLCRPGEQHRFDDESPLLRKHSTPNMTGDYFNSNHNSSSRPDDGGDAGSSGGGRVTTLVVVGTSELYISGTSEALVNSAKEVLEEFFSMCAKVEREREKCLNDSS